MWFLLLPWAAYAAALIVAPDAAALQMTILLGPLNLFIYQAMKVGILEMDRARAGRPMDGKSTLLLLPTGLVGLNQYRLGGEWTDYVLEQFVMEVTALLMALVVVLLFGKNHQGRRTGALALLPAVVVPLGLSGILFTWWDRNDYAHASGLSVLLLTGAFAGECRGYVSILGRVFRKEMTLGTGWSDESKTKALVLQSILWFALPALRYLL